jgi:transcriptional regulator with XRE-family HTH domain
MNKNDTMNNKTNSSGDSEFQRRPEKESSYWESLKKKRLQKKISLDDLSLKTKINARYFEAIENGDFSALPGTYIRLFLKTYSEALGLDFEEVLSHTPPNIQRKPKVPIVPPPVTKTPVPFSAGKRRKRNPLLLLSGVVVIIAAVIVFEYYDNSDSEEYKNAITDTLNQTTLQTNLDPIQVSSEMEDLNPEDHVVLDSPYIMEILPEENLIYLLQINDERSRENLIQKNINHTITLNSAFKLKIFQPDKCRLTLNGQNIPVNTNNPIIIRVDEDGILTLFGTSS